MTSHLKTVGEEKENDIYEYFVNMDDLAYNICYSNWIQDLFQNRVSIQRRQEQEENVREFLSSLCTLHDGNQIAVIALSGTKMKWAFLWEQPLLSAITMGSRTKNS